MLESKFGLFFVALILLGQNASSNDLPVSYYGTYESATPAKIMRDMEMRRTFEISQGHMKYSFKFAENGRADPFLEQHFEGKVVFKQSDINSKVYNVDFSITKNAVIIKRASERLKYFRLRGCFKKFGLEIDILKDGCDDYAIQRGIHENYYLLMIQDPNTLLITTSVRNRDVPSKPSKRPTRIYFHPLVRKL